MLLCRQRPVSACPSRGTVPVCARDLYRTLTPSLTSCVTVGMSRISLSFHFPNYKAGKLMFIYLMICPEDGK